MQPAIHRVLPGKSNPRAHTWPSCASTGNMVRLCTPAAVSHKGVGSVSVLRMRALGLGAHLTPDTCKQQTAGSTTRSSAPSELHQTQHNARDHCAHTTSHRRGCVQHLRTNTEKSGSRSTFEGHLLVVDCSGLLRAKHATSCAVPGTLCQAGLRHSQGRVHHMQTVTSQHSPAPSAPHRGVPACNWNCC